MPKLYTNAPPALTLFFWIACLLILSNKHHSNVNGERVSFQLVNSSEDASVNLDNENIRLASQMLAKYNHKAASLKAAGTGPASISHRRTTSSIGNRGLRGEQSSSTSFEQDTKSRFEEIGSGPEGGRLVQFFDDVNDEPARRGRNLKAPKVRNVKWW